MRPSAPRVLHTGGCRPRLCALHSPAPGRSPGQPSRPGGRPTAARCCREGGAADGVPSGCAAQPAPGQAEVAPFQRCHITRGQPPASSPPGLQIAVHDSEVGVHVMQRLSHVQRHLAPPAETPKHACSENGSRRYAQAYTHAAHQPHMCINASVGRQPARMKLREHVKHSAP